MSQAVEQKQTVKAKQDIVASFANEFRDMLLEKIREGVLQLEVDIQEVKMVDSVGLGVFIAAHNSLQEKDGKLTVSGVNNDLMTLFRTMRLDRHFTILSA